MDHLINSIEYIVEFFCDTQIKQCIPRSKFRN